ncbi:MAG TPA: M42 family metallopeptidase [Candidatus Bathyarchaeia archaeon]|nr:M42 family metallopeptidase [Candidatus Bathyarchaeia archaeon]
MMTDEILETLKKLILAPGPTGFEHRVREVFIKEIKDHVDQVQVDTLGNVIAIKTGRKKNGPKIMVAAHLDEIGLIVKYVDEAGWVYFELLGFVDERALAGQLVSINTDHGTVSGVVGIKGKLFAKPEELAKSIPASEMWIDVGVASRKEALEIGIKIGDPITFQKRFEILRDGNVVCAPSLDNRVGCSVLIEAVREFENEPHDATIYAVGTVQEEVGCRGAKTAASALNPDVAFVVDTTTGEDPATPRKEVATKIGGGPAIRLMDQSLMLGHITLPRMKQFLISTAEAERVPYQLEVIPKVATDAATLHLSGRGILTGSILIPRRYFHTPLEIAMVSDIHNARRLLTAGIKNISSLISLPHAD